MFSPAYGVVEDAATGSAAGPLAIHLARHRQIPYGQQIEILQGVEIGRPSRMYARAEGAGERVSAVEVSGNGAAFAEGRAYLWGQQLHRAAARRKLDCWPALGAVRYRALSVGHGGSAERCGDRSDCWSAARLVRDRVGQGRALGKRADHRRQHRPRRREGWQPALPATRLRLPPLSTAPAVSPFFSPDTW